MPTVIAVDCSLSMSRCLAGQVQDCKENETAKQCTLKQLAQNVAQQIITHMMKSYKLEFTTLISFSSSVEVLCPFTRDFNELLSSVNKIKLQDKVCIEKLFPFISNSIISEWGMSMPCEIIIISDGSLKLRSQLLDKASLKLPFEFPGRIHFLCLASSTHLSQNDGRNKMHGAITANLGRGSIYSLDDHFEEGKSKVDVMVSKFCSDRLNTFKSNLHCGSLSSQIIIFPTPEKQKVLHGISINGYLEIDKDIHIVGFLSISAIKSPPALYRYLILPYENESQLNAENEYSASSTTPSFSVVLHGSLKIDNKIAIVKVQKDWYGMISSWADNKKKSNLVLSLFEVGVNPVPSIGTITDLGLIENSENVPTKKGNDKLVFPPSSLSTGKRSYAQNGIVWTRPTGLQTDIQKLLRNAKKLPEKTTVFYKELNRIRKAALAFGFLELLDGISSLLERECTLLPGTAHPEATLQLSHAANELKTVEGYMNTIQPLKTDFKYHKT